MTYDTSTMPFSLNDIANALDLDRDNIQFVDVRHDYGDGLIIDLELNPTPTACPVCHTMTTKIKGYRFRVIKHSIFDGTPCEIHYKARRYECPLCHKTFYEHNHFALPGTRMSVATVYKVLAALQSPNVTFTDVARHYDVSTTSVINLFDNHVSISRRPLPACLSFDEVFAFESPTSPCVCVLLDNAQNKIVDLIDSRKKTALIEYFTAIPEEERKQVKYVSFDMYETYRVVCKIVFPDAKRIVDKFHVLADLSKRTDAVRLSVQNEHYKKMNELKKKEKELKESNMKLSPEDEEALEIADTSYYLLKKFNWLLYVDKPKLTDPNNEKKYNQKLKRYLNYYDIYELLLKSSKDLEMAINLKDSVHYFYKNCTYENAKAELEDIIKDFRATPVKDLYKFADTLVRWKGEIINSFIKIPELKNKKLNNGLIENRNKTLKTLKRNSNGYTCWSRFRNRALYCLNDDETFKL